MTREEAAKLCEAVVLPTFGSISKNDNHDAYHEAFLMAIAALREKAERERGWGCAYCVIGRRSPDARYCSNCGRKLTPALPELANE